GLLSGLLMVVPNAMLAFYYSAKGRPDIAYSSQIGDCHICIPLCIGLYAIAAPITIPGTFQLGTGLIMGAGATLFLLTALLGRLPKLMGAVLALSYSVFLYQGILS
ncbi:MAG: sodium:calcium symporter, partial [Desulfobacteraceae bacterium]|nr:sodium:calcium symporter [Desulfobacteraceae bacterium]